MLSFKVKNLRKRQASSNRATGALPANSARSRRNASLVDSKRRVDVRHTFSVTFGVETWRALVSNLGLGRSRKRV